MVESKRFFYFSYNKYEIKAYEWLCSHQSALFNGMIRYWKPSKITIFKGNKINRVKIIVDIFFKMN